MKGFILSHHWQDTAHGMELSYWVSTDQGPMCLAFPQQELVCFVPASQQQELPNWPDLKIKPLELKHFQLGPVVGVYCRFYKTLMNLRQYCQHQGIPVWEGDIKPVDRFMMERFIRGSLWFQPSQLNSPDFSAQPLTHETVLLNPKIKPDDYQPNLKRVSVDIETSMPKAHQKEQLYSIGFVGQHQDENGQTQYPTKVFMIGDPAQTRPSWLVLVKTVQELLRAANDWLAEYDPDVIMGWNVVNFDFSVLDRIYRQHSITFDWGRKRQAIRLRSGQNNMTFVDIPGRVIVDGIDALKSATYHFPSFSLENVSRTLLGSGKQLKALDEEPADISNRGQAITDLFLNDKVALAEYNRQDCQLVLDIFNHTHLLEYLIQRSRLTGHTLDRIGGSVAAFEYLYLPKLHRAGYIAPNLGEGFDGVKAPGGFVMDSKPGMYNHVLVLDFKSLYPSIIRTFKIDPMGLIEGLEQPDMEHSIPGYNGGFFHREKHFLPNIIEDLWHARDAAKAQKDSAASTAIKIIMNSFYGVLGSTGCRFFDVRLSSSITQRGHDIIQRTALWIDQQGYEVIYGDTDSVFVWLKDKVPANKANQVGQKLARELNQWWTQEIKSQFNLDSYLELEFETHYQKFLMPTIRGSETGSKKRYAGLTSKGEMQFKGLEAVRSDWTPLAKELQTELYRRIFHDEEYLDYVKEFVQKLLSGQKDNDLIYRKRIRRNLFEYVRNVPPQIQAARKAHDWYKLNGFPSPYEHGGWIEYVLTVNGPEPKEYQGTHLASPLDYQHYLDKQVAPVVDSILHFLGQSFSHIANPQKDIFSDG